MVRTDYGRRGVPWVTLLASRREVPATLNLGARERASVLAALAIAWGIVRRRPLVAAAGLGAEVLLNRDLLALLHERLGAAGSDRRRRPPHGASADGGRRRAGRAARVASLRRP